jgi:hypothetical protein
MKRPGWWIVFASYLERGASTTFDMVTGGLVTLKYGRENLNW